MADDIIFIDGLKFEKPNDKAPEFVKGKLSIHAERLTTFIAQHKNENGYLNIDLCKSKKGDLYLKLNTYKKTVDIPQDVRDSIPF